MRIKKYGHACLLVHLNGVNMVVDPGSYSAAPDATKVSAIFITHEHQDHYDPRVVGQLVALNPGVRIITHEGVGKKLTADGFAYEAIEPGQTLEVSGVSVESVGTDHAIIYGEAPPCRNTGFLIGGELFITGDALHDIPQKPVRVLALPTGGPWMKLSEAIDYAKRVKPQIVFPVHDALYTEKVQRSVGHWFSPNLPGIEYRDLAAGEEKEF